MRLCGYAVLRLSSAERNEIPSAKRLGILQVMQVVQVLLLIKVQSSTV
jgi:hypothetical protein